MTTGTNQDRSLDALRAFLVAMGTGVLFAIGLSSLWFVLVPIAGIIVGAVSRDRTAGFVGLAGGFLILLIGTGFVTVANQMATCEPDCGGLSSPSITIILVVGLGLVTEVVAAVAFVIGRLGRRIVLSRRPA